MSARWTEDDLAKLQATRRQQYTPPPKPATPGALTPTQRYQALGRLPAGKMNKTEAAYAKHLEEQKQAGTVLWYKFEAMKFRLADNTFYTPDFMVLNGKSEMEAHEVKGFWLDDGRAKIKIAASLFPFRFIAAQLVKKEWKIEEF